MIASTRGIVLHTVKFGENSVIATVYTEKSGRQSYIINATHSKTAANKMSLLQPLSILDLIVYEKKTREVQRIKEIKPAISYRSLPFEVRKSTQAIFLAEILFKLLREEEGNPELFDFIANALQYFDLMQEGVGNFYLFFLVKLTKYLGIMPHLPSSGQMGWFDITKGTVAHAEPDHPKYMDQTQTRAFSELIESGIEDLPVLKINQKMRRELLPGIIEFYRHHYDSMGEIKSISVLKEIFD